MAMVRAQGPHNGRSDSHQPLSHSGLRWMTQNQWHMTLKGNSTLLLRWYCTKINNSNEQSGELSVHLTHSMAITILTRGLLNLL